MEGSRGGAHSVSGFHARKDKEMGYRDEKGAVRGQSRRELVSPPPPAANLPFHLYKHPLKLVLVLHPLWGKETEAQRGYGLSTVPELAGPAA